ncbi:hypothetical protein CA12_23380 [Alienimonas californiensis]|uniref:Uncharacterized protein n=2 Tax=Alienimonas californiensis TaxID=2527989 RepID=A0A517PA40_9PLAN|nr:hypothetical protein CA12_23380 [Alienimonas californiensis]
MDIPVVMGLSGWAVMIASWIWLILQIMRGSPPLALVAAFVPLFAMYYVWQNWDIAWRPTVCFAFGFGLNLTAHALR